MHYDRKSGRCREERAEDVSNREVANFCDWFQPSESAFGAPADSGPSAELRALFGEDASSDEDAEKPRNPLDDLFK